MTTIKVYLKAVVAALIVSAGANLITVVNGDWDLKHFAAAEVAAAVTALGVAFTKNSPTPTVN